MCTASMRYRISSAVGLVRACAGVWAGVCGRGCGVNADADGRQAMIALLALASAPAPALVPVSVPVSAPAPACLGEDAVVDLVGGLGRLPRLLLEHTLSESLSLSLPSLFFSLSQERNRESRVRLTMGSSEYCKRECQQQKRILPGDEKNRSCFAMVCHVYRSKIGIGQDL